MKLRPLLFAIAAVNAAIAQSPAPPPPVNASISGVVKDANSGKPLPNYMVSTDVNATWVDNAILTSSATRRRQVMTDDNGRYKLSDLTPGPYRVHANNPQSFGHEVTRSVTLPGSDLDGIDFSFIAEGSISGRVVDDNREPAPGMTVFLITREYYLGTLGYFLRSSATTNDRGEYRLERVEAGHPYFVMAEKRDRSLPARSEVPLNPRLRKRVPIRTWYPNVPMKEGAIAVTVRPSEHREGIDIEVKKSASYCIDGTLLGANGAGSLRFGIEALQPSSGQSSGGGMFMAPIGGTTSADGQFRICDLYPTTYRLTGTEESRGPARQQPPSYVAATITITDRDLSGLRIAAMPGVPLDGEVVWDGDPPPTPTAAKVGLFLEPLLRSFFSGENNDARPEIPGTFSFSGLLVDDYHVRATLNSPGLYVKDVQYGGRSVRYEPLHFGSAVGNTGMRVIVGRDGGTISARVADKDGNPVSDMRVLVIPAVMPSEAFLFDMLRGWSTDQLGQYKSQTLPPGKYLVAASSDVFDATPESMNKLWRSRNRFKEVELAPNGSAQVTLEPVKIE
jgi:Carboxypeptidase regulatory-like domain